MILQCIVNRNNVLHTTTNEIWIMELKVLSFLSSLKF